MVVDSYYGNKHGTTHLSIYTVPDDGSETIVHRLLKDQEAYDTWHLSYYFKYILECVQTREAGDLSFAALPRKEKFLLSYLMLAANSAFERVTELGCSVFEMIDGLELARDVARASGTNIPELDLKSYSYVGVELSEMLARTSRHLHRDYDVEVFKTPAEIEGSLGFLYDRSVTNYVFESRGGARA